MVSSEAQKCQLWGKGQGQENDDKMNELSLCHLLFREESRSMKGRWQYTKFWSPVLIKKSTKYTAKGKGTLQKRGQKDCKSQRIRDCCEIVSPGNIRSYNP